MTNVAGKSDFLQHSSAERDSYASESRARAALEHANSQCRRNLWVTLDTCTKRFDDDTSYVITGDIDAMWTRDSVAQLGPFVQILRHYMATVNLMSGSMQLSLFKESLQAVMPSLASASQGSDSMFSNSSTNPS